MFADLMTSRRFAPLFWCQFLSALNDNFIKNALVILILFRIASENAATLVTLAGATLVVPFFFLSALGGEIADKHDKARVARWIKLAEVPAALIAAIGFLTGSVVLLFLALFLFGLFAALFGPVKYGILPDHLEVRELPAANALVEGATFLAILIGTIAGGIAMASAADGSGQYAPGWLLAILVLALAAGGVATSRLMPSTARGAADLEITRNPITSTFRELSTLRASPSLWTGALITSWFWLVGIAALSLLPTLVKSIGGREDVVTLGLVVFTLGIAFGSLLAARASKERPNLALVPIGAVVMAIVCFDLAAVVWSLAANPLSAEPVGARGLLTTVAGVHLMLDLFALAAAGGLFIVPAFAAVQAWASPDRRARVVGAVNIMNAAFMTSATLLIALLQAIGFGVPALFALLGLGGLAATAFILRAWGAAGIKDLALYLFKTFHGLEVKGAENLPAAGARAIIAPNHTSLIDAPILFAVMPQHAAFAIDTGMAQKSWIKPFLKLVRHEPIDPTRPMGARNMVNLVKGGEPLVIFPEGRLTVTGGLMKVYDGTAMIADKADAVVVPVRIDGPERSPWSYLRKGQIKKVLFPKTTLTILPARKLEVAPGLKGKARRRAAGAALQDIMIDTAVETANLNRTLFEALIDAKATRDTGKPIVADPMGTALGYRGLVLGAQVLGRKLADEYGAQIPVGGAVGVLLPNSVGAAVTFFALQAIGRVPAMLNFSAGPQNVQSACTAAAVEVVVTSRAFIERARLQELIAKLGGQVRIVYLEDVKAKIGFADKVRGVLQGSRPQAVRQPNDAAAILFTSGSEGTPKGVVLSHRNLIANATQSLNKVAAHGEDKVFNVLPMFHSFGLTVGLVMPVTGGVPVFLYPSPLHYRIVPELVYQTNATILFGTDTFLNGYARSAHPYDLHSVRLILAGAEPVKERTRQLYMERFGVRILEGYGVTETAPVLAINTPLANRSGTVGRFLPLVEHRLEAITGIEGGGRLFVRGPNVMLGYLRVERPGVLEPPQDGWHDTGDIVSIDADGFVTIKGRAKRFAKIGGEMVSLAAIEAVAADTWPQAISVVIAVPDARKGERLILLTSEAKAQRADIMVTLKARGASELMVPAEVHAGTAIPLLGSGKPDFAAAARLVAPSLQQAPAA